MRNCLRGLILLMLGLQGLSTGWAQSAPRAVVTPPPKTVPSTAAFNFTPTVVDMDFDGYLAKVVVFKDGTVKRQVGLPSGWKAAGSSGELYLTNPLFPDGRITLRMSSLEPPVKFDDGWIETTRPLILGGLPKDSKEQKIVNVTPNALNLQGWNSIDFKVSFDRLGRRFSTGWMFILLPDKRFLEVVYSAPDEKFTQVRAAATEMLKGWELHVVIGKTPAH